MKSPAFQFYPSDFLVGTAMLSAEETGAYIRLLCYQWEHGSLPNDADKLARLTGCQANAIASIWHKFGICEDGCLRNARLETIRGEQEVYRSKQAENAKKGWEKRKKDGLAMPPHDSGICQTDALQSSSSYSSLNTALIGNGGDAGEDRSVEKPPGMPTQAEVLRFAKDNAIVEACADKWFWKSDGDNWRDRFGKPFANWRSLLRSYSSSWKENDRAATSRSGAKSGSVNADRHIPDAEELREIRREQVESAQSSVPETNPMLERARQRAAMREQSTVGEQ